MNPEPNPNEERYTPPPSPQVKSKDLPYEWDGAPEESVPGRSEESPIIPEQESAASTITTEPIDINLTHTTEQIYEMNKDHFNSSIPDRPLIGDIEPLSVLRAEYEGGQQLFVTQIDWLDSHGFKFVRRARGDGDCFYRSVAFAYVDQILHARDQAFAVDKARAVIMNGATMLKATGFQEIAYEDFYETFLMLVEQVNDPKMVKLTDEILLRTFQSPETSNSIVMFLRLLTSAQIQADPLSYSAFLFHPETELPMTITEFCQNQVEALGKEADHPQLTALSNALKIDMAIAYVDGRNEKLGFVPFDNGLPDGTEPLRLLYRPGHYDILVKSDQGNITN